MKSTQFIFLVSLGCIATALAVDPPPDGGYANQNTAEGEDALFSLAAGFDNTAIGYHALYHGTGAHQNVAVGTNALSGTKTGGFNTAVGAGALEVNTVGLGENTGVGAYSLNQTTLGSLNTAVGYQALYNNRTGSNNIAIGPFAGGLCKLSDNIMIGNDGDKSDAGTIRIGIQGTQTRTFVAGISGQTVAGGTAVMVDSSGMLGTITSSARYKEAIKPMATASEPLLKLKPVTFRYKKNIDPQAIPQFGLVAEEVAKLDPALVVKDAEGKPSTVRYDVVNAMLLNEFLKEHKKVQELEATLAQLQSTIEKVSSRLEANESRSRLVSQ